MSTRDAILAAARDLQAEHDGNFSLRAVARAVGISPMAIYRHFADKDALTRALLDSGHRRLLTALQEGLFADTPRERLAALATAYVRFALDDPGTYRLLFETPSAAQCGHRRAAATFRFLEDRVRECSASGDLPPAAAEALALDIWALLHGHIALHRIGKAVLMEADLNDHVAALLDRMFPRYTPHTKPKA